MTGVLDPSTPFPYLLYTLAGAGLVAYVVPKSLEGLPPLLQDLYRAQPVARILCAVVFWLLWPFLAFLLVTSVIFRIVIWVLDLLEEDDK